MTQQHSPTGLIKQAMDAVKTAVRQQSPELADLLDALPASPELPLPHPAVEGAIDTAETTIRETLVGGKLAWSDEKALPEGGTALILWVTEVIGGAVHVGFYDDASGIGLYAAGYGHDGTRHWVHTQPGEVPYPAILNRPVAAHGDRVAIALLDLTGNNLIMDVLCLSAADGTVLWRQQPSSGDLGLLLGMGVDKTAGKFLATGIAVTSAGEVGAPLLVLNASDGSVQRNDLVGTVASGSDPLDPPLAYGVAAADGGATILAGLARSQTTYAYRPWIARVDADASPTWQSTLEDRAGVALAAFPRAPGVLVGGWSTASAGGNTALAALLDESSGATTWVQEMRLDGRTQPYGWAADPAGAMLFEVGYHYAPELRAFASGRSAATGEQVWLHRDSDLTEPYAAWTGVQASASGDDVFLTGAAGEWGYDSDDNWLAVVTARLRAADGLPLWVASFGGRDGERACYDLALVDDERLVVAGGLGRDNDETDYAAIAVAHEAQGLVEKALGAAGQAIKDTLET